MKQKIKDKKFTESFFEKTSNVFTKLGSFLGNQRHFSTIRDAFGTFMPLIIVGAFGILFNSVFVNPDSLLASLLNIKEGSQAYETWSDVSFFISPIFQGIVDATMSFFSVYMAFLFGYFLMGTYNGNKVFGGLVSLASFLTFSPIAAGGDNPMLYLGTQGILISMFAGLIAPMLLNKFNSIDKLKVSMPESVPPAVAASFSTLFPIIFTIGAFALVQPIWGAISIAIGIGGTIGSVNIEYYYIFGAIYKFVFAPFSKLSNSIWMVIIILSLVGLFWFFGVHGNNAVAPFVNTFWTTAAIANVAILADAGSLQAALDSGLLNTWTDQTMASFASMGGSASVLGLLIGIMMFSKLPSHKQITKVALPPNVFNISEPVLFGLPIIFNPIWFIPYVIVGPIQAVIAYYATQFGLVNPITVMVPWTTPIFLSGFLATQDWRSLFLTALNLSIAIAIFTPFILMDMKSQIKTLSQEKNISQVEYMDVMVVENEELKINRKIERENLMKRSSKTKIEKIDKKITESKLSIDNKINKINENNSNDLKISTKVDKLNYQLEKINISSKEDIKKITDELSKKIEKNDKEFLKQKKISEEKIEISKNRNKIKNEKKDAKKNKK